MIHLHGTVNPKNKLQGALRRWEPSNPVLQSKEVTPTEETQVITPDSGYVGLSSVTVYGASGGGGTVYVIGTPVDVTLSASSWDGTSYAAQIDGYNVGANGVQIGLPSTTSSANAQAVIAAALTIRNTNNGTSAASIHIVAIETPTEDLTISLFGLEPIETEAVTE